MHRLEWLSLRRIGYTRQFEDMNGAGAEVPDDATLGISTSESEGEYDGDDTEDGDEPVLGPSNWNHHVNGSMSVDEDSDDHTDSDDDEHGPEANDTEFPDLNSPDSPTAPPWTNGTRQSLQESAEELGDNGYSVSYRQRKAWERWAVGR